MYLKIIYLEKLVIREKIGNYSAVLTVITRAEILMPKKFQKMLLKKCKNDLKNSKNAFIFIMA